MCSIGVRFNEKNFEYDVYSLVKAFYPGREVHICYEEEEKSFPEEFVVEYQKDRIHVAYRKEGQSQDQEEIALIHTWDRKMTKDRLKQGVYQLLRRLTGKELPWGTLTGIRPTKLVMGMIESGMTNPQIAQFMREEYYVSPQKAALGITIANREREILKEIDYENGYSLYVGIPFCPSICLYCSFSSYPYRQWEKRVGEYVDALKHEICEVSKMMKGRTLDTVYLGGGTPTTLPPEYLDEVLDRKSVV